MQTKPRGQAHDPKALQHLALNLNPNQNLLVKIQSQQVRLSSKTNPVLISLRSYPTLFPRWRLLSTKAQKKKEPRKRKEAPVEHLKVRRSPEEEEADLDHPDGGQDTDPDRGLRNDSGDRSQPRALEITPKRVLISREREADPGQRDARIDPGLVLSEGNIRDPGLAPDELDPGLL